MKSQLLSVVSHELRTPINAIVGFAELLSRDELLTPEARREYCATILENAQELQSQIHDMLDAARLEAGNMRLQPQDASAAELVEAAMARCSRQAEKADITIHTKLDQTVSIHVDTARLRQSLVNLLENAIKFSVTGGIVNVETMRTIDDGLVFSIRDAGVGISVEKLARVFEPFEQAEGGITRSHGGMGLGLSNARAIARLHNGDIRLESSIGAGTTAELVLPPSCVTWPEAAVSPGRSVA